MRRLILPSLVLALLFHEAPAAAFCRTTSNESFVPTATKPCDDKGTPLFWASRCVGFSVQQGASIQIDLATARSLAGNAFAQWSGASCTSCGANGAPSIAAQDLGPVACGNVEYVQGGSGNANVIVFRDGDWPHEGTALALTTVTFNVQTGEIYDADMEIQSNPKEVKLAWSDVIPLDQYDLRSILTHEAGHFLGLAHTQPIHADATMFATYRPGQTFMRDISADDTCGICAAYPPTRTAQCSATPRGGFSSLCGAEASSKGCGCEVVGASSPLSPIALVAGVAVTIGTLRRRKRRAHRVRHDRGV